MLVPATASILAVGLLASLRSRDGQLHPSEATGVTHLVGGISYLLRDRVLLGAALIACCIAYAPPNDWAIFRGRSDLGPQQFGWALMLTSFGAVAATLTLGFKHDAEHKGRLLLGAAIAYASALFAQLFAPWLPLAALLGAVSGAAEAVVGIVAATLIHLRAPAHLHGRLFGLYVVATLGLSPLATRGLYSASRQIGEAGAPVLALAVAAAIVVVALAIPALRRPDAPSGGE